MNNRKLVAVTLHKPGTAEVQVLERFNTIAEAENFLATSATIDPNDLAAGRYGIDAPEIMVNPSSAPTLEDVAREALQFIMTLRDSEPNEALDLLTNNAGEDIETKLAAALGVNLDTPDEDFYTPEVGARNAGGAT